MQAMWMLAIFLLALLALTLVFPAETGLWRLQLLWAPLWRYRWQCAGAVAMVLLPLLLFQSLSPTLAPAPPALRDPVLQALLEGPALSVPEALPPEVFTSAEVEGVRPLLVDASRNWTRLDPEFRQRLLAVFQVMQQRHGYAMTLIEGYRSPQRQDLLARMGHHVSNARAFQSFHQYGLAGDCAFLRAGQVVISERDPWAARGYRLFGETAEAFGLTWGGRWQMADLGHAELRRSR